MRRKLTIFFTRPYAVLQVAVFDTLNSIDYRYREQIVRAAVHGEATREVAVAQAAHDVMTAAGADRVTVSLADACAQVQELASLRRAPAPAAAPAASPL